MPTFLVSYSKHMTSARKILWYWGLNLGPLYMLNTLLLSYTPNLSLV